MSHPDVASRQYPALHPVNLIYKKAQQFNQCLTPAESQPFNSLHTLRLLCIFDDREMAKAQAGLRGREWSAPVAPLVSLLREHLFERQLELISQAYNCLPLESAAAMLGCGDDEAEKGAVLCVCPLCVRMFATRYAYLCVLSNRNARSLAWLFPSLLRLFRCSSLPLAYP